VAIPSSPPGAPDGADDELVTELAGGVLWLRINRPDAQNAIPWYVRDRLTACFRTAHAEPTIRAVVLTGTGERHFCTGADLRVRPPVPAPPPGAEGPVVGTTMLMMRTGFQTLMAAVQDCEVPVLVAMNGTAAGGGAMLALAADLVLAAEHARIVDVFAGRGLIPDGGFTHLLVRLVGMHKAKELCFLGEPLGAAEAAALGIVNRVVPAAELEAAARDWAARLVDRPTRTLGFTKRLLHDATHLDRDRLCYEEAALVELNQATADAAERMAALAERRPPRWRGY
jgi:2-(1,2-epoxy-1,2-dihydrophenyl)acetyl-CoA isomerase